MLQNLLTEMLLVENIQNFIINLLIEIYCKFIN